MDDRIELHFNDVGWEAERQSVLTVAARPGAVESIRFVRVGPDGAGGAAYGPGDGIPVNGKVGVEVRFEAPPKYSGSVAGVDIETGVRPGVGRAQKTRMWPKPVGTGKRTYRTEAIQLLGADAADAPFGAFVVQPGYKLTAQYGKKKVSADIVAGTLTSGKGRLKVVAKNAFGHDKSVAVEISGPRRARISANSTVDLKPGDYQVSVAYPLEYKTTVRLAAGETKTVRVPDDTLGALRFDFRDGVGKPLSPRYVGINKRTPGPPGWGNSGATDRGPVDLPAGTYNIDVSIPTGIGSQESFPGVVIKPHGSTTLAFKPPRGRLRVEIRGAGGASVPGTVKITGDQQKTPLPQIRAPGYVDLPAGDYGLRHDLGPGGSARVTVTAGREATHVFSDIGRMTLSAQGPNGKPVAAAVTIAPAKSGSSRKTVTTRTGKSVDLPAGDYRVSFGAPVGEERTVQLRGGETVAVEVEANVGTIAVTRPGWLPKQTDYLRQDVVVEQRGKTIARLEFGQRKDVSAGRYDLLFKDKSKDHLAYIRIRGVEVKRGENPPVELGGHGRLVFVHPKTGEGYTRYVVVSQPDTGLRLRGGLWRKRNLTAYLTPGVYTINDEKNKTVRRAVVRAGATTTMALK